MKHDRTPRPPRPRTQCYRFQVKGTTYAELFYAAETQCEQFYGDHEYDWWFERIDGDSIDVSSPHGQKLVQAGATADVMAWQI